MACTFNQLLDLVSLASQMLIGSDVLMIQGLLMASMFFLVLTLSHGVHVRKRLLQGPTLSWDTKHWLMRQQSQVTWLKELPIQCDKIGVACIAANLVGHARTKHIGADVHSVCDKVLQKELDIQYVPTKHQVAAILTKPLSVSQLIVLKVELNVKVSPFYLRWRIRQNVP